MRFFDGIEDGLQFAFDIEHRTVRLVLVRRADGDQNFQRAGRRSLRSRMVGAGRRAPGEHARHQSRYAAIGEACRFEGNAEQARACAFKHELDFLELPGGAGGEAFGELAAHIAGEDHSPHRLAQSDKIAFAARAYPFAGLLPRAERARPDEVGVREGEARARCDGLLAGQDLAVELRRNADGGVRQLAEVYGKTNARGRRTSRAEGRLIGGAVDNCVRQIGNLFGGQTRIGPQNSGNFDVAVQQHGNQRTSFVHRIRLENRDLILLPGAGERSVGEEHDTALALLQSIANPGDKVIAGADLPYIPPRVDSFAAQRFRHGANALPIHRAVTKKYLPWGLHITSRCATNSNTAGGIR
nr:hypothetical protein [uncultured bacterium]